MTASRARHPARRRKRRRRWLRDDVIAPWAVLAVILGGWGLAARFVTPSAASDTTRPSIVTAPVQAPAPSAPVEPARVDPVAAAAPTRPGSTLEADTRADVSLLRARDLDVPVSGADRRRLVPSFEDRRGSSRIHEALDILAPRGTPVIAVESGTIARLFVSVMGGLTIYQFDPSGAFCYYYGHLNAYVDGLAEGDAVVRGQTIGYVGTTGNAPANTPHLHFAITRLGPERRWWDGVAIDPYLVLR